MANLTDQLAGVNSGKQIVNPGPAEPSVFGALASFASNSVGGLARLGEASAQRQAQNALNESAQAQFDVRRRATENALNADFAGRVDEVTQAASNFGPGVPGDVQSRVRELTRAVKAVAQGRIPQDRYDLQLEAAQAELFAKYPDQRAAIAQHFQGAGLDHFMFRAIQEDKKAYDAEQAAQTGALTTQFQYAAERGLVTDQTDLEGGARIGREAMAAAARIAKAKEDAEAARADKALSLQEREARLKQASADATTGIIAQVSTSIVPLVDQLSLALSAAGNDADRQTKLGEFRIRTQAALTAQKTRALAEVASAGGDAAARESVTTFFDDQIRSLDSLFTNSFETNSLAMKNIQASFNITAAQAMPAYHTLVAALGQPAVNAAFADPTGQIKLPPEVVASISREMTNFNPADPRGAVSLSRMIGYLRGQTGLQDLSAEEASQYVRTNATIQQANQTALLSGNTSVATNFLANAANTAEAMVEIPPTTQDISSLRVATNLNATSSFRRALREAEKVDPEYARSVATASRNGSAKVMIAARNNLNEGPFVGRFNEGTGRYEATLTRESYNNWAREQRSRNSRVFAERGLSRELNREVPSYEVMRNRIPPNLATRVHVLNANLDHLVETRNYDPTVSNLSPRDTRRLFAQGRMPSTASTGGSGTPNADAEFSKLLDGLDTQLQQLITSTTSRPVPNPDAGRVMNYEARAVGFNQLPESVRTLGDFSEFARGVNRAGANSSAAGIYQITGQTLRGRNEQNGYAEKVFGANWREVPWTNENQDKIAEAIFNDHKDSAEALRGQWVSLSLEEAERVRKLPWSQARTIIAAGESG